MHQRHWAWTVLYLRSLASAYSWGMPASVITLPMPWARACEVDRKYAQAGVMAPNLCKGIIQNPCNPIYRCGLSSWFWWLQLTPQFWPPSLSQMPSCWEAGPCARRKISVRWNWPPPSGSHSGADSASITVSSSCKRGRRVTPLGMANWIKREWLKN